MYISGNGGIMFLTGVVFVLLDFLFGCDFYISVCFMLVTLFSYNWLYPGLFGIIIGIQMFFVVFHFVSGLILSWLFYCRLSCFTLLKVSIHDDVIKWKHLPRYWPFVRGIHRSPVNSPHKGQWREALVFSLICSLNNRLSKESWGWLFETPSRSLCLHCNVGRAII